MKYRLAFLRAFKVSKNLKASQIRKDDRKCLQILQTKALNNISIVELKILPDGKIEELK